MEFPAGTRVRYTHTHRAASGQEFTVIKDGTVQPSLMMHRPYRFVRFDGANIGQAPEVHIRDLAAI